MLNAFVIFTLLGNLALGSFVYFKDRKSSLNISFFAISFSLAVWIFSSFMFWVSRDPLFWGRMMFVGPIILASAFCCFFHVFPPANPPVEFYKKVIFFTPAVIFLGTVPTDFIVREIISPSREVIYGMGNAIFGIYFVFYMGYAFVLLIKKRKKAKGINRIQINYLLIGTYLSTTAGVITNLLLPLLGTSKFNRLGPSFTIIFVALTTYAIVRYRLMDIRVAVTSAGLFVGIYALALGVPFYIYSIGHHFLALALSIILATAAPFTYIYMQQKAKERLLAEQRAYQETLRQASAGMGRIRDLKKLLNLIVSVLTRAVRMEHAFIYIVDAQSGRYRLAASRRSRVSGVMVKPELPAQSMIVEAFNRFSDPLILEEVRSRAAETQDKTLEALASEMDEFMGPLIFPIYSRSDLIAVVVMGKKDRERIYTEDDLATFSILANQAALAIENANYFDDMRRTQEQLFQAEKLATIGTMADGLSHQVNNRFHALGFIAGDLLDTLSQYQKDPARFPINEVFDQLRGGLRRIEENVTQGGQVVRGLLDYSRNTKTEKGPVELKKLLTASLDMVGLKIHLSDFTWEVDFPDDIPHVLGHFVQLQEVFFNIIDNAHHSMMEKKNSRLEPGYEPHMTFRSRLVEGKVHITVTDNGMGVKPEDQRKLFTPFFTTKVSSRLGNGLGLFVMRKVIEDDHGGTISFSSEHTKGVKIKIVLPCMSA